MDPRARQLDLEEYELLSDVRVPGKVVISNQWTRVGELPQQILDSPTCPPDSGDHRPRDSADHPGAVLNYPLQLSNALR